MGSRRRFLRSRRVGMRGGAPPTFWPRNATGRVLTLFTLTLALELTFDSSQMSNCATFGLGAAVRCLRHRLRSLRAGPSCDLKRRNGKSCFFHYRRGYIIAPLRILCAPPVHFVTAMSQRTRINKKNDERATKKSGHFHMGCYDPEPR